MLGRKKLTLPSAQEALPGRAARMPVPARHFVNGARLEPPFPQGVELAQFGMGCFWGAERKFWEAGGVYSTAAGYAGGFTPNPTYEEVCSGATGHDRSGQHQHSVPPNQIRRSLCGRARSAARRSCSTGAPGEGCVCDHDPIPAEARRADARNPRPGDESTAASGFPSSAPAPGAPPARRDRVPKCRECP